MNLESAARHALEALEAAVSDDQPYIVKCKEAITALREALAQPQGEPVFLSYDDPLISETIKSDPLYVFGFSDAKEKVLACYSPDDTAQDWADKIKELK